MGDGGLLAGTAPDLRQRGADLGQSFVPVRAVLAHDPVQRLQHRAVRGQHQRIGSRFQLVQRGQVVAQRAIGSIEDGGTAAQDGVAGEHRAVGPVVGQQEAQRVGGVSRGFHDPQPQAGGMDFLPVEKHLAIAAMLGQGGAHGSAGEPVQRVDALGVVMVPVRDEDQFDGFGGQRRQVPGVVGTRVHDHRVFGSLRAQHIGIGAFQRHGAGVGRQAEGCLAGGHGGLLHAHGPQSRATALRPVRGLAAKR